MAITKKTSPRPQEGAPKRPPMATRPGRATLSRPSGATLPKAMKRPEAAPKPAPVSRPSRAKAPASRQLERQHIAMRAYEIFLERGGAHGHDREDWEQAEMELCGHAGQLKSGQDRRSDPPASRFLED